MDDTFKIFVQRLRDGEIEYIEETLSSAFLDIHEKDLAFNSPIKLLGTASVTDGMLVLQLKVETIASIPCAICNADVEIKILIPDICRDIPVEEIKGSVFDYRELLREEILLAVPYTAECNEGHCPERESLAKYFSSQEK